MNKTRFVRMASAGFVCVAASMLIVTLGEAQSTAIGTRTIEGLVRDIACPLQKTNSTSTSYGEDCIIQCAKAGSPLGILTDDGTVYIPVTETMPDAGQNQLKSFIGDHVKATGKVFERNGAHATQISDIHQVPDAAGK
ncbi:MAG: hypothetical protein WB630_07420 [Candidatus Acidiferrales bacterium]